MNRRASLTVIALTLLATACDPPEAEIPNPVLYMTGDEYYEAGGKNWVRHRYDVQNKDAYPAAMFAAAPSLPPCGSNTNASRSWVDFYDKNGNRLYGFCALGESVRSGPDLVCDRRRHRAAELGLYRDHRSADGHEYKSNLADNDALALQPTRLASSRSISRTGSCSADGSGASVASAAPGSTLCSSARRARKSGQLLPGELRAQHELHARRVHRRAVAVHLVVQVRAGREAGRADVADHLAAAHVLAGATPRCGSCAHSRCRARRRATA